MYVVLSREHLFSIFHYSTNLALLVQISTMCNWFSNMFFCCILFYSTFYFIGSSKTQSYFNSGLEIQLLVFFLITCQVKSSAFYNSFLFFLLLFLSFDSIASSWENFCTVNHQNQKWFFHACSSLLCPQGCSLFQLFSGYYCGIVDLRNAERDKTRDRYLGWISVQAREKSITHTVKPQGKWHLSW